MDAGGGTALVGDVHGGGGDIDSLLSNDPDVGDKGRRLLEPYERHRAHDLRAECYRRGIRPIKKGPNANDNKSGYILLLRKYDGTAANGGVLRDDDMDKRSADDDDAGDDEDDSSAAAAAALTKKRKLVANAAAAAAAANGDTGGVSGAGGDLPSFYEATAPPTLVPVLPMQYPSLAVKPTAASSSSNPTTDLEILSGIANTYTQNAASDGQLCGNCRTVVTDQLMESIRLGKTKMQLHEWHRLAEQRDRDTRHLRDVLQVLADLRKAFREAQADGLNHELLVDLEDDLAFFRALKENTKERMRQSMQDVRDRSNKTNPTV